MKVGPEYSLKVVLLECLFDLDGEAAFGDIFSDICTKALNQYVFLCVVIHCHASSFGIFLLLALICHC